MSVGITKLFNQGKSALSANQTALATTSHNISNVNTEGYSRQRVELHTEDPTRVGKNQIGSGVKVGAVSRTHSDFITRRMEEEGAHLGKYEGMSDIYNQLESVFKDDSQQGVSASVSKFFNDVRTLSTQPESASLRTAVKESADTMTNRFQAVSNSVGQIVEDVNRRVEGDVLDINDLTKKISELNLRIVNTEVTGVSANDERDSRDLLLKKLSQKVGIQTTALENGGINVSSDRLGILVNGADASTLKAVRAPGGANVGGMRVMLSASPDAHSDRDVTDVIDSGSLGGFLKIRDKDIPAMIGKVDTLAHGLATSVNDVHRAGFSRNGAQGENFFSDPGKVEGAASRLAISDALKGDLGNLATGEARNAPGDNRALLKIANLQDSRIFENGHSNFTDFTAGMVGSLGAEARASYDNLEAQRGVVDQLKSMREEVAGVSLDEEAMNMLQYQKAFDASAKMIQTADSMLETVLNLKRF